ncbi:peroxisomal bifunctional enzyme [Luminiphilus syltensis NOR5-1B]|uniref:Peroxisomal bifunctional enzyme n=1 Tax=Luminiphilus syltensis NOR5-1B TaxID=565045 RepID=B8KTB4_9GAMM|nr:3-hydroxyacyl-CoA dehydrogenase NAD-binding domain-containing protein [Luminiphilus syltensis]EED36486.1 peroxisomal bifunctional enzyme [Luminiphilus syltensis NOR5-1B]
MSVVTYHLKDAIGVITIDNPPVNAMSHAVRSGLVDALDTAAEDDSQALLIICKGRTFIAGADISEFGKPPKSPTLRDMLDMLDSHPKLTVAAIHGTALGGGFETALCCNYRCALDTAKVGLPEVKLGLLPGAGGTQRTPRLAGAADAITLITQGNPMPAEQALTSGLIDQVVQGDLLAGAVDYVHRLIAEDAPRRRARDLPFSLSDEDREAIASARKSLAKKTRGEHAPQRILDCIEAAATLDFNSGLARERELFDACMTDPQSAAMRHMFFAERQAAKIQGMDPSVAPRDIGSVGIIGAGTMGGGIAMCFAQAGIPVTLLDMNSDAVTAGLDRIRKNYAISVKRGRFSEEQVNAIMANIEGSSDYADLAETDLVIEAVFENLAVKQDVFRSLDSVCKADAILASNTSYQSIDDIAAVTSRPQSVLGTHFFSPANVMKLLEVVRGAQTDDEIIATAMAVGKKIGKVPVLAGMCYGFIGNRMLRSYGREAQLCLIEGATPAQIDGAMERWGMAMGPIAVGDLAGLDIGYKAREQLTPEQKGKPASYIVADRLVEMGRLGQKSGAGYYQYDPETRARIEDPSVIELAAQCAAELGIKQRSITDEEIVDRLTLALANEGARILEEGIAQRASDIDVVYCFGYGFPRHRGGPMWTIEARGLDNAVQRMKALGNSLDADNWQVAPLLQQLAESGESLKDWQ